MALEMTIRVTADHIKLGKPEECTKCPVALAILDAFPAGTEALVNQDWATVKRGPDDQFLDAELPQPAREFISAFDQPSEWIGPSPVRPFEFQVTWLTLEEQREAEIL
jgi:hypothetical protein